jgi:hypothetical protein
MLETAAGVFFGLLAFHHRGEIWNLACIVFAFGFFGALALGALALPIGLGIYGHENSGFLAAVSTLLACILGVVIYTMAWGILKDWLGSVWAKLRPAKVEKENLSDAA